VQKSAKRASERSGSNCGCTPSQDEPRFAVRETLFEQGEGAFVVAELAIGKREMVGET
jgi:hypothetical protein